MLRGINEQQIFFDEEDNYKFINLLKKYKTICGFKLFAYCLMGNHVHLLIMTSDDPLDRVIKRIGTSFVFWYNTKYERTGHLFQDRFRSEAVNDRAYFFTVLRYIVWNPVKAGICQKPEDYKYSSAREYLKDYHGITDKDIVLTSVEKSDLKEYLQNNPKYQESESALHKKKCSDSTAKELIIKEFGTLTPFVDVPKNRNTFNNSVRALYHQGVSLRQLSRLTGISRKILLRSLRV